MAAARVLAPTFNHTLRAYIAARRRRALSRTRNAFISKSMRSAGGPERWLALLTL